jgi:hypothetical protein
MFFGNRLGYILLSDNDPNLIREKEREKENNFVPCACSNCKPKDLPLITWNLRNVDVDNFTGFVESLSDLPIANSYKAAPLATKCEPGSLR